MADAYRALGIECAMRIALPDAAGARVVTEPGAFA